MKNDARKMALENQIELAQQNAIDFTHACMTIALMKRAMEAKQK